MNATTDLTITTRPLQLTRGQEVILHLIEGSPVPAHVIETPDDARTARRDDPGTLELYVDGRPFGLVDSLEEALGLVRDRARTDHARD